MNHCDYSADDKIDRYAPLSPYQQLACILRARIARGDWPPGCPISSEAQLVGEYGLARSTVRRTIKALADDGTVFVIPQRGTYVTDRQQPSLHRAPYRRDKKTANHETRRGRYAVTDHERDVCEEQLARLEKTSR